jgi:glucosyl-3-phosphoglycerate synthase
MGRVPLLDEILVIDSASTDRTREIAEAEGARVVQHPDVLARYGSFRGKGEALWKSLYETSGDIIVWADTDVKNWHPRMVYGTLGPLLHEPRLQYVKGYYQRPIVEGGVLKEGGGGRVTELVARPLINLFYPELSGLIQPLSGEYAGRRSLLETIPFFTGYAVEIGHLIDAAERVGIEGLGQVDLERRVHRNQELEGLSRMSFVILQAVMKRLEERRKARLFAELGSTMKLPRSGKGRLSLEVIELADQERPPIIRIPEYLERRRVTAGTASDTPAR